MNATATASVNEAKVMGATEFFAALYGKNAPGFLNIFSIPGEESHFVKASFYGLAVKKAQELARDRNVYFGVGLLREALKDGKRGGANDVVAIPALWMDVDVRGDNHRTGALPNTVNEAIDLAYSFALPPSLIVSTGGGIHGYWLFKELWVFDSDEERRRAQSLSRRFQSFLINEAKRQKWVIDNTSDLARILRPVGTINHKNGAVAVTAIEHNADRRFSPMDFEQFIPEEPKAKQKVDARREHGDAERILRARAYARKIPGAVEGEHGDTSTYQAAAKMRDFGLTEVECFDVLWEEFNPRCEPEWSEADLRKKIHNAYSYAKGVPGEKLDERQPEQPPHPADDPRLRVEIGEDRRGSSSPEPKEEGSDPEEDSSHSSQADDWPEIHEDAFLGLAGEICRAIEPFTESDLKAILLHALVGFGNIIGNGAHAIVAADKHPARIDVVLVGATSVGRKTSAWRPIKEILSRIDGPWAKDCVKSGLSTGEGIVYHLRDATAKDIGVSDKRLLAIEPEFSGMLKIMGREGNSLSKILREAWDDGSSLNTLTKNSPLTATNVHFSLVGHTTSEELLRYLTETEKASGFGNRMLWCLVRRARLLPDGNPIPEKILQELATKMMPVIEWASADRRLQRDSTAAELWRTVYPKLSEGKPGLSGAVLNRAEAQTLRLSLIYALMDKSPAIRIEHVRAALAVWDVCQESVYRIFGDMTGDPVADRIIDELRNHTELTKDELVNLFSRHRTGEVDRALIMLENIGRILRERRETGGRPVTVYRLARKARKAR